MKGILKSASDNFVPREVEINTLDDIIKLIDEFDCDIIVGRDSDDEKRLEITVYDGFVE